MDSVRVSHSADTQRPPRSPTTQRGRARDREERVRGVILLNKLRTYCEQFNRTQIYTVTCRRRSESLLQWRPPSHPHPQIAAMRRWILDIKQLESSNFRYKGRSHDKLLSRNCREGLFKTASVLAVMDRHGQLTKSCTLLSEVRHCRARTNPMTASSTTTAHTPPMMRPESLLLVPCRTVR